MKKFRFGVLLPITAMLLSGCAFIDFFKDFLGIQEKQEKEEKEGITVTEVIRLEVGDSQNIEVTPKNKKTVIKTVSYVSNNTSIATVNKGSIKGVSVGQTTVNMSVKTESGKTFNFECDVVVSTKGKTKLNYTYDDYGAYNVANIVNCPLQGKPKVIVIPIWFSDSNLFISKSKKESVREDIRKTVFGTEKETGWHSVSSFYEQESFGKVKIEGIVADWYETGDSYENYAVDTYDGSNYVDTDENLRKEAINDFFRKNKSENRKDYDSNGDGYLDAVLFVYGAPDKGNLGNESYENLWAFCTWTLAEPNTSNPAMNVVFWSSYDFMYAAGTDAEDKTGMSSYGRGDTTNCNIDAHCFIHEFGHIFGLPDYYDYSGQHAPAGGFTMQDNNVGGHDPHSVLAYGWGNAYVPKQTTTIKINDFQSSHDMILLANHDVTSVFDEYILIDLYSPTGLNKFDSDNCYLDGYPQGPEDYGIRIWHVDARLVQYYFDYSSYSWKVRNTLYTNPKVGDVYQAFSNTYYDSTTDNIGYITPLGKDYADYNHLQLIRSDNQFDEWFSIDNMFFDNMTFSMNDYTSQFVNGTNMNDGNPLGWSVKVNQVNEGTASITVTKS